MTQINLNSFRKNFTPKKRSAVAEVISTLLLVVITVVGAVILTSFIDESFVAGSLSVTSGTETTIKAIKLIAYDTRDGADLMNYTSLSNSVNTDQVLLRENAPSPDNRPFDGGTEFMVVQIENKSLNPIFLKNIYLDGVGHTWDVNTSGQDLDATQVTPSSGEYPLSGQFSILCADCNNLPGQYPKNEIQSGERVNILIKLDAANPDIPLSKTMRAQFNIGAEHLSEFLVETGGAQ